jgi:uncharacterized membrane-anchored protein YjiN (DUF445 family)
MPSRLEVVDGHGGDHSGANFSVPGALRGTDVERRRRLRQMRVLATSLLVVAAATYVATHGRHGALGYVNAAAEAGMVGALADWFAVTALFKRPLGLPIPHTAIIPTRKDALGQSLQEFVADNFLRPELVSERIVDIGVATRVGAWLQAGDHAQRVVTEGSRIAAHALERVQRSDVRWVIEEAILPKLAAEPLAATAGELIAEIVDDGAHAGLVDLVAAELHRWLTDNQQRVAGLIEDRAPWWTPQWLDEKVAHRVHGEAMNWVAEIRDDRHHRTRQALDDWLRQLAGDLQHDPQTQTHAEQLKARLLAQPQLARSSVAIWDGLRRGLVASLEHADGVLRRRAVEELVAFGKQLVDDPRVAGRIDDVLSDVGAYVVERHGREIATIISATVDRWDGYEASRRIELHVGPDLQFIRINGTIVGSLAGMAIHGISQVL